MVRQDEDVLHLYSDESGGGCKETNCRVLKKGQTTAVLKESKSFITTLICPHISSHDEVLS